MSRIMRSCDGIARRDVLKVGLGGVLGAPLTLSSLLARSASAGDAGEKPRKEDVSLIVLFLKGGLSTIDVLDLKPDAPPEFRGEFNPIDTVVPGMQICEHLPRVATVADKFTLVRNFTHHDSGHGPADHYMLTGYHPGPLFNPNLKPNNTRPAYGSVIAKKLGPRGSVPAYVCVPKAHASSGPAYLGSSAAPFVVEADPNAPDFTVPDLTPPLEIDPSRLGDRRQLMATVDRFRAAAEVRANRHAKTLSTFQAKAFDLMTSKETRAAFDIGQESDGLRNDYGRTSLGQSLLMARRLVEAGVRCVTIDHTNWDTHYDNFNVLKKDLLPHLDNGLTACLRDLTDRGLLKNTLVAVFGEFGRTPRVNKDAGRDHWGPLNTILLAGGGVVGGRVVGASNDKGERPASDPVGPEDLAATLFHCLGINPAEEFHTPEGRPVPLSNHGRVIEAVL